MHEYLILAVFILNLPEPYIIAQPPKFYSIFTFLFILAAMPTSPEENTQASDNDLVEKDLQLEDTQPSENVDRQPEDESLAYGNFQKKADKEGQRSTLKFNSNRKTKGGKHPPDPAPKLTAPVKRRKMTSRSDSFLRNPPRYPPPPAKRRTKITPKKRGAPRKRKESDSSSSEDEHPGKRASQKPAGRADNNKRKQDEERRRYFEGFVSSE